MQITHVDYQWISSILILFGPSQKHLMDCKDGISPTWVQPPKSPNADRPAARLAADQDFKFPENRSAHDQTAQKSDIAWHSQSSINWTGELVEHQLSVSAVTKQSYACEHGDSIAEAARVSERKLLNEKLDSFFSGKDGESRLLRLNLGKIVL